MKFFSWQVNLTTHHPNNVDDQGISCVNIRYSRFTNKRDKAIELNIFHLFDPQELFVGDRNMGPIIGEYRQRIDDGKTNPGVVQGGENEKRIIILNA